MIIYQFHNKMQYVHEDLLKRLLDGIIIILLLVFFFQNHLTPNSFCSCIRVISFDDEIQFFIYLYSILINCYHTITSAREM